MGYNTNWMFPKVGTIKEVKTPRPPIEEPFEIEIPKEVNEDNYEVIGVEAKSNGYLTQEEKVKCKWLLENNIFSKILIASKGKKRGEIVYDEFKETKII